MKLKNILILLIMFSAMLYAQEPEDTEQAVEEKTWTLRFKDINVFEYDLDLVFEDEEGEVVWFAYFDIDLSEYDLYTIEDHDGFPEYHVNEDKVGKQFEVTYIETEIEGEFSGELEEAMVIIGLKEIVSSDDEE